MNSLCSPPLRLPFVKRMGQAFETAECANCGQPIRHIFWGFGGTLWTHVDGGRVLCHKAVKAEPVAFSITPVPE